jgi:hypothetical protein
MNTNSIMFLDLVKLTAPEISRTKIKLNQWDKTSNPIDVFVLNPDEINENWLLWKAERYFKNGELAINFVQYASDLWLLTTIREITVEAPGVYRTAKRPEFAHLYGRLIVKHRKDSRTSVRWAKGILEQLTVEQVLPAVFDSEGFPGYDNVRLSFAKLESIVRRQKADWVSALENQKAVYLITDMKDGKHYVGSAYGENGMLLQRWTNYAADGHGGNKILKSVVETRGFDYIKQHFQYAILENYNARVDKKIILQREAWWKETLGSRAFGLNAN